MKKVILFCSLISVASITGCSTTPPPKPVEPVVAPAPPKPQLIAGTEKLEKMERREVIQAIQECEEESMKGYVEYLTQRTEFGKVMVVAELTLTFWKVPLTRLIVTLPVVVVYCSVKLEIVVLAKVRFPTLVVVFPNPTEALPKVATVLKFASNCVSGIGAVADPNTFGTPI